MHRHDLGSIHGTNERIATREYAQAIKIYHRFIMDAVGEAEALVFAER